jgi:hypothetical protein
MFRAVMIAISSLAALGIDLRVSRIFSSTN